MKETSQGGKKKKEKKKKAKQEHIKTVEGKLFICILVI